jgi:2-methylcitrate dehydratase PrpD
MDDPGHFRCPRLAVIVTLTEELITAALASYEEVEARRAGSRALFDYLACLTAGRRVAPDGLGDAGAAVIQDRDDVHWPSVTHPGAIIWSVLRATMASPPELWRAAHAGYEVTARLGRALGAQHRRYWHATATAGTIGGAVAAAVALGGDPANAAGHAISVAGGSILCILERTGTRVLHRVHAVETALRCAQTDRLPATRHGLEHERGFFAAMGGTSQELLAPARPALSEVSFRRHATSGFAQALVEAAQELAPIEGTPDIEVEVPEAAVALAGNPEPQNAEEAWWSCEHAVAVTLRGLDLEECPADEPSVAVLRRRVRLRAGDVSRVTVAGRTAERAGAARLSDEDLLAKWRRLNPDVVPPTDVLA